MSRDLKLLLETTLSSLQLRKLARALAENQGVPVTLQSLARAAQASTQTVKKLLVAMEGLFLIRTIETEGSVSKMSYYFEDQGLASHLIADRSNRVYEIQRGLWSQLRQELHYRPHPRNRIFSYRTHDGTDIPLVFETPDGKLGVLPLDAPEPTLKALASARSFLKKFPDAKVIIAGTMKVASTRDFRIFLVPAVWLC